MGRQSRNLQTDRNHTFGDAKCPGGKQSMAGKGRTCLFPNVSFGLLGPHYNNISFADEKYSSSTDTMTLLIKIK